MNPEYPGAGADAVWRSLVLPSGYENPVPEGRYNLVVIGAGPAGLITSIAAAGLGAKVALIERHAMGGDCLNVGCVPSKSLLHAAREARAGGLDAPAAFDQALAWLRTVRAGIARHDSVERYRAAGVDVFLGAASFVDAHTIAVAGRVLRTRRTVIATGARAHVPEIAGLDRRDALTNENIFELRRRPRAIAVVGGGPIGCELSQAFATLGISVHLIDSGPRILHRDEPDAAAIVAAALARSGVRLWPNERPVRWEQARRQLILAGGATLEVDEVLIAAGRRPNIDGLGLERIGIEADALQGIRVDARLRTRCRNVYAIGDVASRLQFTHHADAQARIVLQNALFGGRVRADTLLVPWTTYTAPELAHIGAVSSELEARGERYRAHRVQWNELDRGRTDDDLEGFAEVLVRAGSDRILGATVVGSDAGEHIAPLAVLMNNGLGLRSLGRTILPYPTRSEYLRRLADAHNRERLTPRVARLLRAWLRFARRG